MVENRGLAFGVRRSALAGAPIHAPTVIRRAIMDGNGTHVVITERRTVPYALLILVLGLFAACSDEKPERGISYMPEMYHTPAFKSQTAFEQRSATEIRQIPAMLPPPAGSVAREAAPYRLGALDFIAAKDLTNPLLADAATLRQGRRWFDISCATCHGRDGNASHASVAPTPARPERFTGVPALNGTNVMRLSDGEIFHIISRGRARMPSLHAQLLPATRWAVVHYLRLLNRAALASNDAEALLAQMEATVAAGGDKAAAIAPEDLVLQRRLVAQRKQDLALIQAGGDGNDFALPPAPRPEYEQKNWPEP